MNVFKFLTLINYYSKHSHMVKQMLAFNMKLCIMISGWICFDGWFKIIYGCIAKIHKQHSLSNIMLIVYYQYI